MKIENQGDVKESEVLGASTSAGNNLQVEEKRRRAWEQWSTDDIAAFFEGLNEFGKDFDAIHQCLITKNKKKSLVNATNIKNKDQVRHFYYRTWHKISKYILPTPDEGKKMHKELIGLINYGEMWKKLGGYFNDRCGEKLNELVQQGATLVKIKGKTHRIKTPVCTALKKLQSPVAAAPTDTQSKPSVPDKIVMELTPSCNADFLRVQSVAHNPRIRICSDSSSPLSSIISFLTKKWKPRSIFDAESAAEDELIMRIAPDTKTAPVVNNIPNNRKGRKRTFSEQEHQDQQEQIDEPEVKPEAIRTWTLDVADQVTVGEVYIQYGGVDGRLPLTYSWERRSKPAEPDSNDHPDYDAVSLLRALVSVAKSSLTKFQSVQLGETSLPVGNKKAPRRQIVQSQISEGPSASDSGISISARSPLSEASPTQNPSLESPVQFSRMRQRLRRPLRYGSSLKRASLTPTLNKMPGPSAGSSGLVRSHQPSLMVPQPTTTVNITWPPEEDGNGTGSSFVLQVCLDSQGQKQLQQRPNLQNETPPPSISGNIPDPHISPELDRDFFRPPSILLHTPVKGGSVGWGAASTASSLPSTPHRLQEWMSILMPNTPEKNGTAGPSAMPTAESSSVRSVPFSIPDSLSTFLEEHGGTIRTSSLHSGEGSTWPTRDGDEISLSSLLNQLVSPAKSTASSRYTDFKLPFDLQSLVADNSVDLTAKFEQLAASIAAADAGTSKTSSRP